MDWYEMLEIRYQIWPVIRGIPKTERERDWEREKMNEKYYEGGEIWTRVNRMKEMLYSGKVGPKCSALKKMR